MTASTGKFSISNGQIIGPDGSQFVARGINVMETGPSAATLLQDFPGINFVRLAIYDYASPNTLQSYITDLTSHGIVVELEDHNNNAGNAGGGTGQIFSGQTLTNELNWYASVASAFKANPLVWFGTNNEPSETDSSGNNNPAALSDWQAATYNAIRGTGNTSPVLLEANGWSNNGQPVMIQGYKAADYASMTNTIWDIHYYGWLPGYSTDQATNNNFLSQMVQQVQQVTSADGKMAVLVGEYGNSTTGTSIDPNGDQVINAVLNAGLNSGLSSTAWAWGQGNPGDGLTSANGSLSSFGQQVAAGIKAIAAKYPGSTTGVSPGTAVTPSATNTVVKAGFTTAITDASGNQWTITSGGQVAVNGTADATTANVIELAYVNGTVWQENTSNLWWGKTSPTASWSPNAGTASNPLLAMPTASADGTVLKAGSTGAIIDVSGNKWTITSGGQIALNGTADAATANVIELAYVKGEIWQENSANLWWGKLSPTDAWSPNAGTSTSPLPSAPSTLTLRVSEDAYQGDAQFTVKVDGTQVGGTMSASALHSSGDDGVFNLTGNWAAGSHQVAISFINDLYGGTASTDRNFYVDSIAYNGTTQSGSSATMMGNGTSTFTVGSSVAAANSPADTVTVHLAEDAYQGNAQFSLLIDGKVVTTAQDVVALHSAGAWQDLTFSGNFGAGSHTIGVQFANDAYGGTTTTDRNLYVNGIDVNGTHYGSGVTAMMSNSTTNFTVTTTH